MKKQSSSKSWNSHSFLSTKYKNFYTVMLICVIVGGLITIGIVQYKAYNNNKNNNQIMNDITDNVDENNQAPHQLRRGSSRDKAYEPEKLGHMNIFIRKSNENDNRRDLERYRFPVARYERNRFPLNGPFLSFMPQIPLFVDRLTKQTIIFAPTGGIYILPPVINFFGRRFSIAELIASGYASLVSSGVPPSGPIDMMSYFQPTSLFSAGIPGINPFTGGFRGGIRTKHKSFHIRKQSRKYVDIDTAYESEEEEEDEEDNYHHDENYDRESSYSDHGYEKSPPQRYHPSRTHRPNTKQTTKTTTPKIPVSDVQWGPCTHPALIETEAECGLLSVPLDYNNPKGSKIKIALSRIKHTVSDDKFQGILLINPGGPGESGLPLVLLARALPKEVNETYDFIGFDPRGVGSSEPAITCIPPSPDAPVGPAPEPIPSNQILEDIWLNITKTYAMACAKNYKQLLPHMTTVDIAKDMESIRLALRQKQINYYGFSAGTYLGQIYATLYPSNVRRMVLDSNLNPDEVWYQASLEFSPGIDRNIKIWFQWLAKYHNFYHLGRTKSEVEYQWYNVRKQLETNPIKGMIGPYEWINIFIGVAYTQETWLQLGAAFSALVNENNDTLILQEFQNIINAQGGNSGDAFNFVICTDAPWPRDVQKFLIDYWRVFSKAPIVTWATTWGFAPCQFWAQKGHKSVIVNGENINDILLVIQTLDPVLSLNDSLRVRELFPGARLIVVEDGTTHSGSLRGNTCVDTVIATYLESGDVPSRKNGNVADIECAALPQPIPDPLMVPYKKRKFRNHLRHHLPRIHRRK